jgi:hypothetical protein
MSEDEEKKGYTVRDRRRFDQTGTPRSDGEDRPREAPAPQQPAREPPRAAPQRPEPPRMQGRDPRAAPQRPGPEEMRPRRATGPERVDFASLVLSIATNAMISIQGSPDERIPGKPNLPAAAQHIDILVMLEEKTRGNLEPEEEELLHSVLYDLRMHYVAAAQEVEKTTR